ncbi:hypothetical protein SCHPADRAFT_892831 [Schizopora paradoxa]|uniref:Uncharacterized protein n=1 Tax=Schizopora paradoxa TaxID=27342 RepID=A0A0H2RYF9_9AGAM|nr:hypothetical protein SCHPADRAFT_892831 [Schizopora paradoxa]
MALWDARSPSPDLESRSLATSEEAASNSALARIDGPDDVEEFIPHRGGLRSSLIKFGRDGFTAVWMKASPKSLHSPLQIANEIRRLRGHGESTIYQRHRAFHDEGRSSPRLDDLVPLCMSLVTYPRRAIVYEPINELSVEDPDIYFLFQKCRREAQLELRPPKDQEHPLPHSDDIQAKYLLWSKLLSNTSSWELGADFEAMKSSSDSLELFMQSRNLRYLSFEFLPHALAIKVRGKSLALLSAIWNDFIFYVTERFTSPGWIKNMNLCFKNIVLSGKPLDIFASPDQLANIALYLVEKSRTGYDLQFIYATFFSIPKIEFFDSKDSRYDVIVTYHTPVCGWDLVTASSYASSFLEAFDFSRGSVPNFGVPMKDTVFTEPMWMVFYETISNAKLSYRDALGVEHYRKLQDTLKIDLTPLEDRPRRLVFATGINSARSNILHKFFVAQIVHIDRYHKLAVDILSLDSTFLTATLEDRDRLQSYMRVPKGVPDNIYIPQFRNVPYLRRFWNGKRYAITGEGPPDSIFEAETSRGREDIIDDLTVDTMLLDEYALTLLHVNTDNDDKSFDCTGHYPILAGTDYVTGEPLYVAFVRLDFNSPWYFTTVKDGASSAKYMNEIGEEQISQDFFVLALRHDPVDRPPQDVHDRTGTKDPTGPVYWVEFWPKKDAHYVNDERLRDGRHLESFLDDLHERKIMEGILEGFD